jgi:hypothetical protein
MMTTTMKKMIMIHFNIKSLKNNLDSMNPERKIKTLFMYQKMLPRFKSRDNKRAHRIRFRKNQILKRILTQKNL